ncbi:hypothetical protein A2U01_0021525 [Trifolium medium]|uniref:Uncharacterized protein n=1 Tax=Trifolium medium TaxID=97028 RepID=A0A392NN45_9FABA|nr:hypothetical protein [Trifolium medium]
MAAALRRFNFSSRSLKSVICYVSLLPTLGSSSSALIRSAHTAAAVDLSSHDICTSLKVCFNDSSSSSYVVTGVNAKSELTFDQANKLIALTLTECNKFVSPESESHTPAGHTVHEPTIVHSLHEDESVGHEAKVGLDQKWTRFQALSAYHLWSPLSRDVVLYNMSICEKIHTIIRNHPILAGLFRGKSEGAIHLKFTNDYNRVYGTCTRKRNPNRKELPRDKFGKIIWHPIPYATYLVGKYFYG